MENDFSVLVIGAGVAGLSAAYQLQKLGVKVTVIEALDIGGGRMSERREGAVTYNTGARLVYSFSESLNSLIAELGLSDSVVPLPVLSADCESEGDTYKIYLNSNLRTLMNPKLSLRDKVKLVLWALQLFRLRAKVSPNFMVSGNEYDDRTLADYIREKLGPRFLKYIIEPIFRGTRSWNPEEITPGFFMTTAPHLAAGSRLFVFKEGMGQLTRALMEKLDVKLNCPVDKIVREDNGKVVCKTKSGEELRADIVINAMPGGGAAGILENPTTDEEKLFGAVRYNQLGVVHYVLNTDVEPALRFIPRTSGSRLSTYQQLPRSPEQKRNQAMLYCQLSPEANREAVQLGMQERLDELIRDDVRSLYPQLDRHIDSVVNQWIEHKLPVPYPGYGKIVDRFLAVQSGRKQNIYYCGDYLSQALVTGACESGIAVADLVNKHWNLS